ncbi:recombinase RecT [Hungatella effluvii]|uniref:recombinase RecT n=1 Tax=Hungatella effluvii TaxID=1096246 RepID=UPI001DE798DA|nr:recombinase RecT [Hungatella effluvii]MBS5607564.1 recombinase RecT [Enterocloster asparagiformis]
MAVGNSLASRQQRTGLTAYLTQDAVRDQINKVVGGRNGSRFISSIVSAVQATPALQECTNSSILSAALLGESLNLSPSPQLGQYYLVPYDNRSKGAKEAQFQLGYKGYIQLATRSGQYKKLTVLAIKEGELVRFDPLNEEIEIRLIEDEEEREQAPAMGYYAMFEYTNGFRKALYWSRAKMEAHAKKYSPGYKKDLEKGTKWTFWAKDFDGMAYKTMLRQLISKWGIMSIDLVQAIDADMAVIHEDGTKEYVETEDVVADVQTEGDTVLDQTVPEETPQAVASAAQTSGTPSVDDVTASFFS